MSSQNLDALPSGSGRIVKRSPPEGSQQGKLNSSSHRLPDQREIENSSNVVSSEEIEQIIRQRRKRFERNKPRAGKDSKKHQMYSDEQTNRSKGEPQEEFVLERARKKGDIMERIYQLEGRIQKQHPQQERKILVRDQTPQEEPSHYSPPRSPPRPKELGVLDKLTNETFRQILQDMRLRHREELQSLTRHNQLKVRSLESMIRSKDSVIRQLEMEAARTRDYIQQLQKSLSNSPL